MGHNFNSFPAVPAWALQQIENLRLDLEQYKARYSELESEFEGMRLAYKAMFDRMIAYEEGENELEVQKARCVGIEKALQTVAQHEPWIYGCDYELKECGGCRKMISVAKKALEEARGE